MSWTGGSTRATSDLITATIWNSYLGASGSLEYLHDAGQWVFGESAGGTKGTANLTFTSASAYVSGKLAVYYNGVRVNTSYYTEASSTSFTFTAAFRTTVLGGGNIASTDDIYLDYVKDE